MANKVAWSESRIKKFRECPRAYWFSYYLSNNGWRPDASERSKLAYRLKKITNLAMWCGSVVHNVIEFAIKSKLSTGILTSPSDMKSKAIKMFRDGWKESITKEWMNRPSKAVNLAEHYFKTGASNDQAKTIKDKAMKCIDNLHLTAHWDNLMSLQRDDIFPVEQFATFNLTGGEPVMVKLDAAYKYHDSVVLVDWKTGKPNDFISEQMMTYAMFALKSGWTKRVGNILLSPVFLGSEKQWDVETTIKVDMDRLKAQADVIKREQHILDEIDSYSDDESRFAATGNTYTCTSCNFRTICPRQGNYTCVETPFD